MPAITQGATASITLSGTTAPGTSGVAWEIRKGGTVVATSSAPNGWSVVRESETSASVGVPSNAPTSPSSFAEDYEIRHAGFGVAAP